MIALAAMGKKSEAIQYAESCRGPRTHEGEVDAICEQILLSSGRVDEAYQRITGEPRCHVWSPFASETPTSRRSTEPSATDSRHTS